MSLRSCSTGSGKSPWSTPYSISSAAVSLTISPALEKTDQSMHQTSISAKGRSHSQSHPLSQFITTRHHNTRHNPSSPINHSINPSLNQSINPSSLRPPNDQSINQSLNQLSHLPCPTHVASSPSGRSQSTAQGLPFFRRTIHSLSTKSPGRCKKLHIPERSR